MTGEAAKWNARYRRSAPGSAAPAEVLHSFRHLLPSQGDALDLAAGAGGNALFLAERGLRVQAWDIAELGLDKLAERAASLGRRIELQVRDVAAAPPPPGCCDVIVVSHFLERRIMPALIAALRPRGLLFYQTFSKARTPGSGGPNNPAYRLERNELLKLCAELTLVAYREENLLGDVRHGFRNQAWLVGQKTAP